MKQLALLRMGRHGSPWALVDAAVQNRQTGLGPVQLPERAQVCGLSLLARFGDLLHKVSVQGAGREGQAVPANG